MNETVCYNCIHFKITEDGCQCKAYGFLDTSIILYKDKAYNECEDVILDSLQKKIDYYKGLKKFLKSNEYGYYKPRL